MSLPSARSPHEADRLLELEAFAAIDAASHVDIDDLTRLATGLCRAPIAAVSFVDATRQWFSSGHGAIAGIETPRDLSFCGHAIGGTGLFEVADAAADARFAHSPLVTGDPRIRFYAGAPLVTAHGHALGALCVIDHRPRSLDDPQREALQLLSRQVIRRLEHQHSRHHLQRLVTERSEHVQQIRDVVDTRAVSEERLSMVLSALQAGYWDWDLEHGIVSYSQRFAEMFQLGAPGPLPAQEIFAAVDDLALESLHAALGRLFEGRVDRLRHEFRRRSGGAPPVWLEMRGQVTAWTAGGQPRRALGLAIDITAERRKDEHRRAAQKLDALGALAAGVAHEINTPLQFVSHNLDFLASHAATVSAVASQVGDARAPRPTGGDGDGAATVDSASFDFVRQEFAGAIAESIDGIDRVTTIVRALKEFSHPGGTRDLADMNRMIEHAITLTRHEWKFVATVARDLDPDLPPVAWAAHECGQLLVNLLVNAAHAIQAAVRAGDRGQITVRTRQAGGQVEIQVSDTGTGVPSAIRDHIFEPFFTTKDVGKGTGQGLATARAIVERHGGTLALETEVGRGSTFIVRLPPASDRRAA